VAALVSIAIVPKLDNGQTEFPTRYETSRLLSLGHGSEVCKSEYDIAGRTANGPGGGDPVDMDVLMSFGWSLARDGTAHSAPPHMWAPKLSTDNASMGPAAAACAAAALRTYGAIANLDHDEKMIPDRRLFDRAYAEAAALDRMGSPTAPLLPVGLRPVKHVAVLFSEAARDAVIGLSPEQAWKTVLYPTAGAWGSLVRAREPTGMVVDWKMEDQAPEALAAEWAALVAPAAGTLLASTEAALGRFVSAGGVLVRLNETDRWESAAARPGLAARLIADLRRVAGRPPVKATGAEGLSLVSSQPSSALLAMTGRF
jgi:hypothetical protein